MRMRGRWAGVGGAGAACGALAVCFAACGGGDEDSAADADAGSTSQVDAGSGVGPDGAPLPTGDAADPLDGASELSPRQACEVYLDAACTRLHECGKRIDCEPLKAFCPDSYLGEGIARTQDQLLACAEAHRNQSCQDIANGIDLPCVASGTKAGGDACHFNAQCRSGRCESGNSGACGTCLALAANGDHCDAQHLCGLNIDCLGGVCTPRTAPTPSPVGSACNVHGSCPPEAPCIAASSGVDAGTCTPAPGEGEPCGFYPEQAFASVCAPPTRCVRPDPTVHTGTCSHLPSPLGGACGRSVGADCSADTFCSDAESGTCQPLRTQAQSCHGSAECEAELFCSDALSCEPRVGIGAVCTTLNQCQRGQDCVAAFDGGTSDGHCIDISGVGEPCGGPNAACVRSLRCVDGACALAVCAAGG